MRSEEHNSAAASPAVASSAAGRRPRAELEWLDLAALTRMVAVSERTLRAWIHAADDALPAVRVGRKLLVNRSELHAWLGRRRVKPAGSLDLDAMVEDTFVELRAEN